MTGRLTGSDIVRLLTTRPYQAVVDATHPYATVVTQEIRGACEATGVLRIRVVRPSTEGDWHTVSHLTEAAELLAGLPGNILLTTGAKELVPFATPELADRCYPRVLPSHASLEACLQAGSPPKNILCMQGPFSQMLNEAVIEQYQIAHLVTKDTGTAGGFQEKVAAAQNQGCHLVVVGRPSQEEGVTVEEALAQLDSLPPGPREAPKFP